MNGQSAQTPSHENSVSHLSVKIKIGPLPDNVLLPTNDPTIYFNLYRDCEITGNAIRKGTSFIDTSKTFAMASFENIPYGKYCLKIKFMKFGLKEKTIPIELSSDSTFTVLLEPKTTYDVMVAAKPKQYALYGGYLKVEDQEEPREYSLVGESDMMNGRIRFTIVGRKKYWKIKLGLENKDEGQFTKFDETFSSGLFRLKRRRDVPIVQTNETGTAVFVWIKVEKVE